MYPNGRPSVTNEADFITNESYNHTEGVREKKNLNYFGKEYVDFIFRLQTKEYTCQDHVASEETVRTHMWYPHQKCIPSI